MEKIIIAAVADNMAIGKDNSLLWHISEDLKFFKEQTSGYPVVMGRRTFESIGRALPKRLNIVVSRSAVAKSFKANADSSGSCHTGTGQTQERTGLAYVSSLDEAFISAAESMGISPERDEVSISGKTGKCFMIGGGEIYRQGMDYADKMIITHVHTVIPDADTFFPEIDPSVWIVSERSDLRQDPETGYGFEFVTYIRQHNT